MATGKISCGVCCGSGRVDQNYFESPGFHLGPHNSTICSACSGQGSTEFWLPDPVDPGLGDPVHQQPSRAEPWYPWVDAWFEENVSRSLAGWTTLFCVFLFAIIGGVFATEAGFSEEEVWVAVGGGALAGLLVIQLAILAVKLLLLCLRLAIVAAIFWGFYHLFDG